MDNLKRGTTFLQQAWRTARANPGLLRPSVYALAAGLAASLVCLVPAALSLVFLGGSLWGPLLAGFFGALLVSAQLLAGFLFSAATVYRFSEALTGSDGRIEPGWAFFRRRGLDLSSLAVASSLIGLARLLRSGRRDHPGQERAGGVLSALWTEAAYLVLPAMVLEDLDLKAALARTAQMVGDNLLLMRASVVGVKWVNALIGLVLGGAGIALGLAAGIGFADLAHGNPVGLFAAIAGGILIASLFSLAAVAVTAYAAAAYHTCLFLWAREVERTRAAGQAETAAPPAPLAASLANITSLSMPIYS